jgi:hypothetical protein
MTAPSISASTPAWLHIGFEGAAAQWSDLDAAIETATAKRS